MLIHLISGKKKEDKNKCDEIPDPARGMIFDGVDELDQNLELELQGKKGRADFSNKPVGNKAQFGDNDGGSSMHSIGNDTFESK